MASGIVKDIDENFCQCSICLDQFKEPKLLPCLHRFCKDCLAGVIKQSQGYLACPVCREECIVPKEGLDGFKTDFYMKNLIEYVQLQTSLEENHTQECCGCSKTIKVSAYCFKCNDFLCEACHQLHVTSKITKDHRPHLLAVEDVASERLTLDKLASLKEAPRCFTHSEKLSELCCKSCSNTPICIACTYGNHKGHDFYEVTGLANEERHKLEQELTELFSYEKKILEVPKKLEKLQKDIQTVVSDKTKHLQAEHVNKKGNIEEELRNLETKHKFSKANEEERLKDELFPLQQEMEKELQKIREKYNKLCDEKRQEVKNALEITQRQHDEQVVKLREKLSVLNTGYKEAKESLLTQQQGNLRKTQEIAEQYKSMIKRYDNLKVTTSTLLKSMNDWTVVQCIPEILAAKKPLIEEMRKQIPAELDTLIDIKMKPLPSISLDCRVPITIQKESTVNIEGIAAKGWEIFNLTAIENGRIAITGNATRTSSHISVIDIMGKVVLQQTLENDSYTKPDRLCDFLSDSKIVTACDPRELGIYNTDDNKLYFYKDVRASTSEWPRQRGVTCVACDPDNYQIILGNWNSQYLYVFDRQVNFRHGLTAPNPIGGCHDIVFCGSNLVVCDYDRGIVLSMNMEGETAYTVEKPNWVGLTPWKPISVCTDSRRLIYILWCNGILPYTGSHVITQNSPEGGKLLTGKQVDRDAFCLATMKTNEAEKLLVATRKKGQFFVYDLIPQE